MWSRVGKRDIVFNIACITKVRGLDAFRTVDSLVGHGMWQS